MSTLRDRHLCPNRKHFTVLRTLELPRALQLTSARGRVNERKVCCRDPFGIRAGNGWYLGTFRLSSRKTKREAVDDLLRKVRSRFRWLLLRKLYYPCKRWVVRSAYRLGQGLIRLPLRRLVDSFVFFEMIYLLAKYRGRIRMRARHRRLFFDPCFVRVQRNYIVLAIFGYVSLWFLSFVLCLFTAWLGLAILLCQLLWSARNPGRESTWAWGPFVAVDVPVFFGTLAVKLITVPIGFFMAT